MRASMMVLVVFGFLVTGARPAGAQEVQVPEKDPAVALGFAFLCPGCGHLYTGETVRGALVAAISVGAVATGFAVQVSRFGRTATECAWSATAPLCPARSPGTDLTPLLVGSAIGLAGYVYGLIDAGPSARRMNRRDAAGFGVVDVKPAVDVDGSLRADVGIRLSTRW
jgi:hypothetical protein